MRQGAVWGQAEEDREGEESQQVEMTDGPEDMDVDPHRERAFRRGYLSGIYDALTGVRRRLTDDEFRRLEVWMQDSLTAWAATNLEKPIRPPEPSDPSLRHVDRKHGDGPFCLSKS